MSNFKAVGDAIYGSSPGENYWRNSYGTSTENFNAILWRINHAGILELMCVPGRVMPERIHREMYIEKSKWYYEVICGSQFYSNPRQTSWEFIEINLKRSSSRAGSGRFFYRLLKGYQKGTKQWSKKGGQRKPNKNKER